MKILISILLFSQVLILNAQDTVNKKFLIGLSFGVTNIRISDTYINTQLYKGTPVKPLTFNYAFYDNKNLHFVKFGFTKIKLTNDAGYYDYNYINYWNLYLHYDYARLIFNYKQTCKLYGGVSYKGHVTNIDHYYKNILYYYAQGTKESYDLSLATLYLNITGNINIKNQSIYAGYNFSVLNYGQRPDIYNNYDQSNKIFTYKEFQAYRFFLMYTVEMTKQLNFEMNTNIELYKYEFPYELEKIETQVQIGLAYKIWGK